MATAEARQLLTKAALGRVLKRMAAEIVEIAHRDGALAETHSGAGEASGSPSPSTDSAAALVPVLLGIRTGGAHLAHRLAKVIRKQGEPEPAVGELDITLYRDDVYRGHEVATVGPSRVPVSLEGALVFLVDDVLFTGRTVRAALSLIHDLGRPRAVRLVALIDRGWRELPIQADIVGTTVDTARGDRVEVRLKEDDESDAVMLLPHS